MSGEGEVGLKEENWGRGDLKRKMDGEGEIEGRE